MLKIFEVSHAQSSSLKIEKFYSSEDRVVEQADFNLL